MYDGLGRPSYFNRLKCSEPIIIHHGRQTVDRCGLPEAFGGRPIKKPGLGMRPGWFSEREKPLTRTGQLPHATTAGKGEQSDQAQSGQSQGCRLGNDNRIIIDEDVVDLHSGEAAGPSILNDEMREIGVDVS